MAMKQCIERLYSPEHLIKCVYPLVQTGRRGEMAEWLKARASKACIPLRVSGVRIPLSPPLYLSYLVSPEGLRKLANTKGGGNESRSIRYGVAGRWNSRSKRVWRSLNLSFVLRLL